MLFAKQAQKLCVMNEYIWAFAVLIKSKVFLFCVAINITYKSLYESLNGLMKDLVLNS